MYTPDLGVLAVSARNPLGGGLVNPSSSGTFTGVTLPSRLPVIGTKAPTPAINTPAPRLPVPAGSPIGRALPPAERLPVKPLVSIAPSPIAAPLPRADQAATGGGQTTGGTVTLPGSGGGAPQIADETAGMMGGLDGNSMVLLLAAGLGIYLLASKKRRA